MLINDIYYINFFKQYARVVLILLCQFKDFIGIIIAELLPETNCLPDVRRAVRTAKPHEPFGFIIEPFFIVYHIIHSLCSSPWRFFGSSLPQKSLLWVAWLRCHGRLLSMPFRFFESSFPSLLRKKFPICFRWFFIIRNRKLGTSRSKGFNKGIGNLNRYPRAVRLTVIQVRSTRT